jgi:hypothetical protein
MNVTVNGHTVNLKEAAEEGGILASRLDLVDSIG